ncbi:MAG: type II toxin-antitoxin system RelE/ParE family toxin [Treponema sp.]|nr:type II toxin-antitoxin system RelE/ParE family toxin [Treponema sp.]
MYKLKYSCFYRDELRAAIKYIRQNLKNPIAAQRLKDEVKETYKKIKENPFMYPVVPDEYWASKGFRFTMVKNYILFYKVKEKQINIDRFLYGHRDWMNILAN